MDTHVKTKIVEIDGISVIYVTAHGITKAYIWPKPVIKKVEPIIYFEEYIEEMEEVA